MADHWWNRVAYALSSFGDRVGEETGLFDVAEEFQKYDDGDMSAVDWLKTSVSSGMLFGAAKQALDVPLSTLGAGAHEVNRAIGADLRSSMGTEGWKGLLPSFDTHYDVKPYEDYFTGGFDTEEERASYAKERGLSPNQAAGAYTPVTAGDAYMIGVDKAINRYGRGVLWTPIGWAYAAGGVFNDKEGVQSNHSYLPRSFDMWAQDAGLQVWERSDMRHQLIAGNLVVETAVDPLNFFGGAIASAISGMRSARLVATTAKNMPDSAMVAQSMDVIANTAVENQRWLRGRQWIPGRGLWSPERMLNEMATNPEQRRMLEGLALEKDRTVLRKWLVNRRMANGDGADGLAAMMAALDRPEEIAALLYAASYRDETAIRITMDALERKVNTMPLANELRTQTGLSTNPFEGASFMFGNGHLPDGHLLRMEAKNYVNEAIERHFNATNPTPGAENTIRKQWDALAAEVRKQYLDELSGHQTGMLAAEKVFERSNVARPLERMATRGDVGLRKLERARSAGDQRAMVRSVDWLTAHTPAIKLNGRSSRTSASVWLMSRPGLTFSLHGMDAVQKFDDIIHYVDGLLGRSPTVGADRQAAARFIDDDVVKGLRDRFVSAGAVTRAPEQIRAGLVDELQKHALARIAQNRGAEYMAGHIIADEGMKKAGGVADALNKMDTGYATVAIEDYVPLILASHPSAIRQTANFVPLMDLKAVDDALKSSGLQAWTSPTGLMSEARVRQELDLVSGKNRDRVARVGRTAPVRAIHTITDVADVVNTVFKMQVLLRLGYPVRNVSEAHLSAFASGVGWVQTLKAAGLTPAGMKFMLGNFMTNARHSPQRYIDRVQTKQGLVTNEDALVSTARGLEAGSTMLTNSILNAIRLGTDPATVSRAMRMYHFGTPEERAVAAEELRTIAAWRASMAHHLDPEHPLVRDGLVAHDARQSGTFWHTDATGALNGKVDPAKLDGPISVVSDRVVAQNAVDNGWKPPSDWRQVDISPGKVTGSWRMKPGLFARQNQQQALVDLHAAQVAAGAKPKWRVNQKGGITFQGTAGRDEFIAALEDAAKNAPDQTTKVVLANIRKKVDTAAKWNTHQKELKALAKDNHVQYRVNSQSAWVDWPGPLEYVGGKGHNAYEFRTIAKPTSGGKPSTVQLEVWSPEVDLTNATIRQAALDKYTDLDQGILDAASNGDRAAQERISEVFASKGIYRLRLPEGNTAWNGEHVLIHPKGIGDAAFTNMVNRNVEEAIQAVAATNYVNVPLLEQGMTAARRKALNRGIGAVNETPSARGLDAMVGGTAPKMVTPETTATEMLERGGFTALLDELAATSVNLRSQQEAVRSAYLMRRAKVAKLAKKPKGTPPALWKMASAYRNYYAVDDMLHGPDGGAYAQVTSGDLTQTQIYGIAAHQGDLLNDMSRAIMNPEEITPGDPRYFEALSNLLGRQYRDMPGAVAPSGELTFRDIDPVFLRAVALEGDREQLLNDTIDWVLSSTEGRDWLKGLNLKPAKDVPAALKAAEKAQARRGAVPLLTDADHRRVIRQNWQDGVDDPVRVDVADVVKATFAFADSHLPTQRVRDLFLSGQSDAASLEKAFQEEPWDLRAFNGLVTPSHPTFRQAMRQRAANEDAVGFVAGTLTQFLGKALEKIGSGPETRLARHPVYLAIGKQDLQQRISFAEHTLGRELNMDEVLELRAASQKFAVHKMEQTLYTLKSRSSVDDFLRFVVPFFPAWRNTMHRWGTFAMENPAGVAQVGRLYNSTFGELPWFDSATGHEVEPDSSNANEAYTLLPGVGSWIPGWKDDPVMGEAMRRTRVTQRSLDVIFQGDAFNPGAGPWVAVPIQAILTYKAELYNSPVGHEVAKWFLPIGPQQTGSATLDAVSAFLPSFIKPLFNKAFGTQSFISTRNRIASTYYANGYNLKPNGDEKDSKQIDAEINTATTKMLGVKTLMYLVSPVSAQQIGDHEFYAGQFRSLMEVSPDSKTAEDTFLDRFGNDRWWYTRSSTSNLTGGMATGQVVANQKANDEVAFEATEEFGDPRLLGFTDNLGPNGETLKYDPEDYNPYARNWQMQHKPGTSDLPYRGTKNFAQYKDDAEIQLGWRYYDYGMKLLDQQLQSEGYQPGTPDFIKERGVRSASVAGYVSQWVPQWAQSREVIDTAKTERNAAYFNWLVNDSSWVQQQGRGNLPVIDSIRRYLADRESVRAEIGKQKALNPRAGSTSGAASNEYAAMWLRTRREMYAQDSPSFEDWVNRYFRNDGIQYEAPSLFPQEAIVP